MIFGASSNTNYSRILQFPERNCSDWGTPWGHVRREFKLVRLLIRELGGHNQGAMEPGQTWKLALPQILALFRVKPSDGVQHCPSSSGLGGWSSPSVLSRKVAAHESFKVAERIKSGGKSRFSTKAKVRQNSLARFALLLTGWLKHTEKKQTTP